jgi:hypothetical protein
VNGDKDLDRHERQRHKRSQQRCGRERLPASVEGGRRLLPLRLRRAFKDPHLYCLKNRGNNGPKFQRSEQADSLAGAVRNRISWIQLR